MKVLGLVAEYNPFHNGHLHHLLESKKVTDATHTIAVMSGNFLQRGEPALLDKWTRAEIAVKNGVDLVIELPAIYATQSAEFFSHGSISTLNSLNVVDSICFGSECGNIDALNFIAEIMAKEPKPYVDILKSHLDTNISFPRARANAILEYITKCEYSNFLNLDFTQMLSSPNNILGLEYIKCLINFNSSITPHTIQRFKADYNSKTIDNICSATAIRESLKDTGLVSPIKSAVPPYTYEIMMDKVNSNFNFVFDEDFYDLINYSILRNYNDLSYLFDINEGIENKILKSIFKSFSLIELAKEIKSKKYTLTRVKRILNNILLNISKEDVLYSKSITSMPYARILSFNDKGREIIKKIKSSSEVEIINKMSTTAFNKDPHFNFLIKHDINATNIYNSVYYKNNRALLKGFMDYYISPQYVKNQ